MGHVYSMDYDSDNAVDLYSFMKNIFDVSYNGNRAPVPIFIHTPWFNANRTADLVKFRGERAR